MHKFDWVISLNMYLDLHIILNMQIWYTISEVLHKFDANQNEQSRWFIKEYYDHILKKKKKTSFDVGIGTYMYRPIELP